jgi:subtilisin-like proprotein convertase family protein
MKKNELTHWAKNIFLVLVAAVILFSGCSKKDQITGDAISPSTDPDPFFSYAWHLSNTGQKVFATTAGEAGKDLHLSDTIASGILGNGVRVLVSDDGLDDAHEDLTDNFVLGVSKDYTTANPYISNHSLPKTSNDNHGTCVSGLIAAVGWNHLGARGVAPKASLAMANFLSDNVTQSSGVIIDQASGDFDIFNMSWGVTQNTLSFPDSGLTSQLQYGVQNYRAGKGAIYVKAAGNDFLVGCHNATSTACIGLSNFDPDDTNFYQIVVGALDASGNATSYSSPGANLWVSAPGGEFGDDSPAMITTDRSGCTNGYAKSGSSSSLAFQRGGYFNTNCNYTATFNGTSSATPVTSGVVALMLEANPALTWRDVKFILAKTAAPSHYSVGSLSHPLNLTLPTGAVWEQKWIVNAAGFYFHNYYGFGNVDVDAAVNMAKIYSTSFGTYTDTGFADDLGSLSLAIPDNSATGVTSSMVVASALKIEGVQLKVWVTHADIGELAIELTSPSGTKSIVVNMRNSLQGMGNYVGEQFLTNAFYQEPSAGTWTIKLIDGKAAKTGTLTRWSLNFAGAP